MLALKDTERNIVISINIKKDFIRRSAFPKPLLILDLRPVIILKIVYKKVPKIEIAHSLISQFIAKTFGPNKINF